MKIYDFKLYNNRIEKNFDRKKNENSIKYIFEIKYKKKNGKCTKDTFQVPLVELKCGFFCYYICMIYETKFK